MVDHFSNTLPETNNSPLKIGRAPKGNDRIPTIHFQVPTFSFREGNPYAPIPFASGFGVD